MRTLTSKQKELLEILERKGVWTINELSKELLLEKQRVRSLVKSIRKRFLSGENISYIFTAVNGYSIEEHPEHIAFESRMRLQIGFGVLLNGVFVFKRCKKIAQDQFKVLNIEYKPKMLTVNSLIK